MKQSKKYVLAKRKARVCQTCKKHRNKPSRCTLKGANKFVERKDKACDDNYEWNGRKLFTLEHECKNCGGACECSDKVENTNVKQEETING